MADYGIAIPSKMASKNTDSLVRPVVSSVALENGFVVSLSAGYSATSGEAEVWTAVQPAVGADLTHLWMLIEPEVVTTNSQYRGLDPDPRNWILPIGEIGTVYKLQVGDIVRLSDTALAGVKGANTHVVATAGAWQLTWAAAAVSGASLKLLQTTSISIGLGSIGTQRVTAYDFEVVAIA